MPTAKATSDGSRQVDTATSRNDAKASATAPDTQDGGRWISTSRSKTAADGTTVTEKVFGQQDDESDNPQSTWQWITGSGQESGKNNSNDGDVEANTGGGATASTASTGNKNASAGVVNGKAVAMAG